MMFQGSMTALMTPFRDGAVDWDAFDCLVERQIEHGSSGLVVCGTTGETPTLTHEEYIAIVKRSVEIVKRRIPVIAGTGTNATAKTIELTQQAESLGIDASLIVAPYYNKPTQEGLYAHFSTIHDNTAKPIIVYNIPGRSVVDIQTETLIRIAKLPRIVGVKDATGDLSRPAQIREMIGEGFCQLSGEDATIIPYLQQGGHGCISVTSNIEPGLCAELHESMKNGNLARAKEIDSMLAPLHKALFCESSPSPAKYAARRFGLCTDEMRLPLLPASPAARIMVDEALANLHPELTQDEETAVRAHG